MQFRCRVVFSCWFTRLSPVQVFVFRLASIYWTASLLNWAKKRVFPTFAAQIFMKKYCLQFGLYFYWSDQVITWERLIGKTLFLLRTWACGNCVLKIKILKEPAEWSCCLGKLKLFLRLLWGQSDEAEGIGHEGCHCTAILQKGRRHLPAVTGYKKGLVKQQRAAWPFQDAILCISGWF